jgi:hypothetical protein
MVSFEFRRFEPLISITVRQIVLKKCVLFLYVAE